MDNCTRFVIEQVNHTHEHYHQYSHDVTMNVITGIGVAACVVVTVFFLGWVVVRKIKERRERQHGPVQFGLSLVSD